jgi:NIMA (never in mitosis gene a)-related kinase
MSKSVKKKEPIDSSSKKNIIINNEASLNQTTKKLIKKDERVKSVYNKVKSVKKMNSNSPKNNTSYFALKKRDEKIKNKLEDKQINTARDKISKTEKKLKVVINNMVTTINEEPKGDLNLTEFTKINQIGKGTFGKIYAVKWKKNGKKYALKKETFNDQEFYEKRNEIKKIINSFLEKTQSNGVIKIYANLLRKNMDEYNYYELMEIGERDWDQEIIIRRKKEQYYTEPELFNIANQLINTLSLMQKNHITHRDIKHQNILVVNGNYKLCDFGEIRSMKGNGVVVQRIRGSELFMSPILFYGLRANLIQVKHNTYKSDVFSLGMCLLYAATMHFDGTDEIRELIDMNKIKIILEKFLKERYSDKFINLLLKMLETNEDLRPDFEQLEKDFANL